MKTTSFGKSLHPQKRHDIENLYSYASWNRNSRSQLLCRAIEELLSVPEMLPKQVILAILISPKQFMDKSQKVQTAQVLSITISSHGRMFGVPK